MPVLYGNNAATTLATAASSTATTMVLAAGTCARFPSASVSATDSSQSTYFYATIEDTAGYMEIVRVTGVSYATDTVTVTRGQDETTPRSWAVGAKFELRIVKAMLNDFKTDVYSGLPPNMPNLDYIGMGNEGLLFKDQYGGGAIFFDAFGRVGIGAAPECSLDVTGMDLATSRLRLLMASTSLTTYLTPYGGSIELNGGNGAEVLGFNSSGKIELRTTGYQRLIVRDDGKVGIGTTYPSTTLEVSGSEATGGLVTVHSATSGAASFVSFRNSAYSVCGSIAVNAAGTTTTYNTSSDYRLKENIRPMTDALARVAELKPCLYTWRTDGSVGEGFIAHELQEVCPGAVTGEKDAVDGEGKPKYQGIDTSVLVAALTAAIQELKNIVDMQAARIATMEARQAGTL